MSYDDDRRRRRRDDSLPPGYEEEEIIAARRGPKSGSRSKTNPIPRPRDSSESSVEEIRRDFPPRGHSYDRRRDYPPRRSKSARESTRGSRYTDDYDDDYYDNRDQRSDKRRKRRDYSSSDSSRSPPPRRDRERRKSVPEQALEALGIGGAGGATIAALMGGGKSRDKDERSSSRRDRKSRRYSSSSASSSSRSRSRSRRKGAADPREKLIQAAKAAAIAGGTEAWRMRNEPGDWKGKKGRRVLTAAVGAAGVDGLLDKDPDKKGTLHTISSAIAGLAGNRVINGSRTEERSRSRSRGRGRDDSRDGGGKSGLGLGGATALAGLATKAISSARSKSRGRGRRDYSSSSDDSRSYRGGGRRAKSVSDYMRSGLGKLGIGNNTNKRDTVDRGSLSPPRTRDIGNGAILPATGAAGAAAVSRPRGGGPGGSINRSTSSSSSNTISSTEEETERKHLGRKQLITAGLASVATIHAAHEVYSSYEKARELDKEVAEGDITAKDARRKKQKARMRQAASVGIAALGVKGAYSEWKEVQESRHEKLEFDEKIKKHRERRALRSQGYGSTMGSTETDSFVHDGTSTYQPSTAAPGTTQYRSNAPPAEYYYEKGPEQYAAGQQAPPSAGPNAYYPDGPSTRYDDGNPYQAPQDHGIPNMGPPPGYQ